MKFACPHPSESLHVIPASLDGKRISWAYCDLCDRRFVLEGREKLRPRRVIPLPAFRNQA
jgi:hypothetical protein